MNGKLIELAAKYSGLAYVFGFATVMVHTASYGLPVVRVLEPLNFWVGAIPAALAIFTWHSLRKWWKAPSGISNLAGKVIEKIGVRISVSIQVVAFTIGFLLTPMMYERIRGIYWTTGFKPQPESYLSLPLLLIFIFFFLGTLERSKQKLDSELKAVKLLAERQAIITLLFVAIFSFEFYVIELYPRLPQRWGFGRPSLVRLITAPRSVPAELLPEAQPVQGAEITRRVQLLYKSETEYIVLCEECRNRIVSLNTSAVMGVIWQEAQFPPEKAK